ncbi:MAG: efflux RND transporter permease subunit [Candidatus Eisenbacteria bacterium]|uniref:Efflux RND transporter permease subunit n=1 Tax=Eiseniibacteriota bacterium TaxID=2212470 RepID=A0A956N924_UNCEI|nr:efflux RND transporter permease subunit [Candidatus Eisenbacteria bacterium]MCB9466238.1 efflux RND transporter permease subunit [Candidatus Eisenbacteria bacterium]
MTLPEIAISRPVSMLMLIVSLLVLGAVALVKLPLAFLPEVQEPELFVIVPYPNATPSQVERSIVRPMEDALGSVSGLESLWSMCNQDEGRIRLDFAWGADLALARMEVREAVDRVRRDLPDDVERIVISTNWDARESDSPILEGRLSSPRDLSESYDLLDRRIVKPLERIPGVAQVRLDGVNPKEVRIRLRPDDLVAYGIDVREVSRALRTQNFDQSLGQVEEPGLNHQLRTVGTFQSLAEIENLAVRSDGLRLRDVADVTYEEPPLEYGRHLDGDFAIGISVSKESSANTVEICREVRERVAAMADDPELEGVNFLIWENQGQEIERTLADLLFTGIFGAILASVVLYVFLRRVSSTLVAVSCIPFSLIVACGFIWAQGKTLNTVSLLGLIVGIGMLVDNAVVVMENVFRHQERGKDRVTAARMGAKEVSTAVIAATLTSVIVFLPLIFNEPNEMNIILRELGITVCITLLASLFISQTLIPLATAHFLSEEGNRARSRASLALDRVVEQFMSRLTRGYRRVLKLGLRHLWLTPIVGLLVVASGYFPAQEIDFNFDTSESEAFVGVRYEFSEPLTLDRKQEVVSQVEAELVGHKDELTTKSIYSFWSDRWAMTRLYMAEGKTTEKDVAEARRVTKSYLPELPGVKLEIMDAGPMWRQDRGKRVAFQLVGEDSEVLATLAEEAKSLLGEIPGLVDPFSSLEEGGQEMVVSYDRDLTARYGVDPRQPAEVIQLTYRGQNLPRFRTADGERPMRLLLGEKDVSSMSELRNLPLYNREGERVPLASLADFRILPGAERIQRDDRQTSVWVGAKYEDGKREDYLPLVHSALATMEFPYGYNYSFDRTQSRREEQSREFLVNLGLALLLIFAVMAGLFESARQATALMVALPFALSGALWTLWLTKTDFDQPAAVGALLLIGIVVNNGIVMLEHVNMYRRRGMRRNRALLLGGSERIRPILMTALTTLIGLFPIWVQKPALAGIYYYSMALVIMGGLAVSTVLTSVLLPTTAVILEDVPGWIARGGRRLRRSGGAGTQPSKAHEGVQA